MDGARHCGTRQKGTVDGISMVARIAGLRHWLSRAVVDIVARHGQWVAIGDGARSAPSVGGTADAGRDGARQPDSESLSSGLMSRAAIYGTDGRPEEMRLTVYVEVGHGLWGIPSWIAG